MQSYDFYFIYVCLCLKILIYSAYLRGCSSLCCTNKANGAIFRGCSSLCCTNQANDAFLLGWCT